MTGNKFNGITHFLKGKRSFCAVLLAMIFLFTTSIAAYALPIEPPTADPPAMTYAGKQDVELQTVAGSVYYTTNNIVSNVVYASDFAGGNGSVDNPYEVATAEQLNNMRNYLDSHFIQTADINLGVEPYNTGAGWEPIGNDWYQFTGTFDGNGKIISKLTIKSTGRYVGLFGFTNGSHIKNVKLEDVNVTGDYQVGGLVGDNKDGEITNSYATGAVTGIGDDEVDVVDVGGLVGYNEGVITNSYATGAVTGTGGDEVYVGGLVGYNDGAITNSYATGAVTGIGDDVVGAGGLVGINDQGAITASFWDTETSGMKSSAGEEGKTTAEMKKQETYEGWDFNAIWSINGIRNNGYPFLKANTPNEPDVDAVYADRDALTWDSIKGENGAPDNVTTNLTNPLPTTGTNGTAISWRADPANWINTTTGEVTRPTSTQGDQTVSLTATISKGAISYTKSFTLTITVRSSSSGTSSGSSSTTPSGTQVTSSGRTASHNGVNLTFPAGAVESDIQVQVKETALTTGMTLPDNSQLLSHIMDIVKDKSGNFLKPVTITISFDNSELDPDEYDIAIYYYDEDTGKWIALDNIRLNFNSGNISGDTTHFTKFAVIATPKTVKEEKPVKPVTPQPTVNIPTDISGHWAKDSIMKMINAGVISGYPDGTFKPDKAVTRAEFTVMIVKALNLETRAGKTFTDTASHWAKESIATAAAHGIISGYDSNTFGPDDLITREQAAVIIALAAKLEAASNELNFTDSKAISPWAKPGVTAAVKAGFITGYPDNSFRPQGNTTRAEAVSLILKAI
jgi:hypothetical protein